MGNHIMGNHIGPLADIFTYQGNANFVRTGNSLFSHRRSLLMKYMCTNRLFNNSLTVANQGTDLYCWPTVTFSIPMNRQCPD